MFARYLFLLLLLPGLCGAADGELFRFGGKVYTPDRISTRMSQLYGSMLSEQHNAAKQLIDEMVFDVYVEQEAKRLGKPVQEVGFGMLQVKEPTEDEVTAFYEANKQQIGQPLDAVADRLRKLLHRQAMKRKRDDLIKRIKREGHFELLLRSPPTPAVAIDTRGRPFKGHPDAPITLVEFGDFQCPNCKRAAELIDTLMTDYPNMLKVYYMDFPLNPSGISRKVAAGGVCAMAQGQFWPYHDLAYAEQERLNHNSAVELATALELDMELFNACLARSSTPAQVNVSFNEGRRLGINATPTLFVDGKPFVSQHLIRDLGAYIRRHQNDTKGNARKDDGNEPKHNG